eukprot:scaffold802_cov280-Pinguiococcus_pyrenoidosus.AAC.6
MAFGKAVFGGRESFTRKKKKVSRQDKRSPRSSNAFRLEDMTPRPTLAGSGKESSRQPIQAKAPLRRIVAQRPGLWPRLDCGQALKVFRGESGCYGHHRNVGLVFRIRRQDITRMTWVHQERRSAIAHEEELQQRLCDQQSSGEDQSVLGQQRGGVRIQGLEDRDGQHEVEDNHQARGDEVQLLHQVGGYVLQAAHLEERREHEAADRQGFGVGKNDEADDANDLARALGVVRRVLQDQSQGEQKHDQHRVQELQVHCVGLVSEEVHQASGPSTLPSQLEQNREVHDHGGDGHHDQEDGVVPGPADRGPGRAQVHEGHHDLDEGVVQVEHGVRGRLQAHRQQRQVHQGEQHGRQRQVSQVHVDGPLRHQHDVHDEDQDVDQQPYHLHLDVFDAVIPSHGGRCRVASLGKLLSLLLPGWLCGARLQRRQQGGA